MFALIFENITALRDVDSVYLGVDAEYRLSDIRLNRSLHPER